MQHNSSQSIRGAFIEFFKKKEHVHMPHSPLIPSNDPSLMFVNSGMVQFKDIFTGHENTSIKRAVTHQKCIRAGGKHNDLDNVGYTNRHHTFFEMLGNFSFGDYFKEAAIFYAWEMLTQVYALPKEKLLITVHDSDSESWNIWKKLTGFSDEKIIKIKTSDNFWSMGETGPCGPCSEIFYDHGTDIQGGVPGSKEQDGPRYVEIWNIVFMQFTQIDKTTQIELKHKSIDTGMGLERIAAVLQGVNDTYETDIFSQLITTAKEIAKKPYSNKEKIAYKIVSDHARSISFLIADGILPSNEGRGYVLRRIMRRAMRYEHHLATQSPMLQALSEKTIDLMQSSYPELTKARELILDTIDQEKLKFQSTLKKGIGILDQVSKDLTKGNMLSGKIAFDLYDTYGFPLDLTQEIMRDQGITVDQSEFEACMQQQQERARKDGSFVAKKDSIWFPLLNTWGPTKFIKDTQSLATVIAIIKDDQLHQSLDQKDEIDTFFLVANVTPFYAESGGQIGDQGIMFGDNASIRILDTKKILNKLHVHTAILEKGKVTEGDVLNLQIDTQYRESVARNHSATHILQATLLKRLSSTVTQQGSLVTHERLRFDFNHQKPLSEFEIASIEDGVNEVILQNLPVFEKYISIQDAFDEGAIALFGEKYESEVRVISIGSDSQYYSKELCGGSHVSQTGQIGAFKIISESAIASGIRRIEAVTGKYAFLHHQKSDSLVKTIVRQLGCTHETIVEKLDSLVKKNTELLNINKTLYCNLLEWSTDKITAKGIKIDEAILVYEEFQALDPKILKEIATKSAKNVKNALVIFTSFQGEKSSITIAVSQEISEKISALNVLSMISEFLQNRGGGNKLLAQIGVDTKSLKKLNLLSALQEKLNQ
jgi:alanyl-tRNA synthetase